MKGSGRLYVDAYGEPGRAATSLSIYAPAVVWFSGSDADLESLFARVRCALGLRNDYEFHGRKLTKLERRTQLPRRVFELLLDGDARFECFCPVMHKSKSRLPVGLAGKALTHELISQAVIQMPREYIANVTLTFDDQAVGKKVSTAARELKAVVNARLRAHGREYRLGRVIPKPSHLCAGLQMADLLAAAVAEPWPKCLSLFKAGQIHSWLT